MSDTDFPSLDGPFSTAPLDNGGDMGVSGSSMGANGASAGDESYAGMNAADLESVFDVPVRVSAILGHTRIPVSDLLRLDEGVVLELDRKVGESIDLLVNDKLVARGEVVMVEDKLGVTMTEIITDE